MPLMQWLRSASLTSPFQWDWRTTIYLIGEYASKDQKILPSREDFTKPLSGSHSSSPTNPPKCSSKLRCSTPIVPYLLFSLPHRIGLHLHPPPSRRRPTQPSIETLWKVESHPHYWGSINKRDFHASRPKLGFPSQRRRSQAHEIK